jgi:hypothetical protein
MYGEWCRGRSVSRLSRPTCDEGCSLWAGHQELTGRFPGQGADFDNISGTDLKVVNFEQTHPRGCHRFAATPLAGANRANSQERQTQRIRALCRALFDNGDRCEGSGLSHYSTRNGGRVAKTRGCSSTPSKTRTNANAVAISSRF